MINRLNLDVNKIKLCLISHVFDEYGDTELNDLWKDFDDQLNSVVGFKEDIDGWGKGYYVCIDKDGNIIFDEVSISDFCNDDTCVNHEHGLHYNIIHCHGSRIYTYRYYS
jgi:hypothetical protein